MTTVAVTGASGFIGRHFCEWLRRHDHDPRPLPRSLLAGDRLPESLQGAESVVHLAARAHAFDDSAINPADKFHAANVELTRKVAHACAAAGVRRLVYVSSAGVLGDASPPGGFRDDSPPAPHDDYTRSKLAAEAMLREEFPTAPETIIVRPPTVYGPDAPGNFARIRLLALSRWPLPVGRLNSPRSMISIRNLCDLLARAATSTEGNGLRMLAADAEITSVADLTRTIASAAGRRPRILDVSPALMAAGLRLAHREAELRGLLQPFVLRGTMANSELGWVPPFRFKDEVAWSVATHAGRTR